MAIQFLRGTKSEVIASNKVLADGQPLYEKDTNKLKVGDGSTAAKSLPYVKVDTDSELSSTSTNPVQNKVINTELEKKLSLSGGTMTGELTTKGIKLTSGTDYGTTLPSSPATDQLFFQTAETNFVLDNVYPIGSIYMNVTSTNPETLFGGTWKQIQGKFLLGMSSSYPAGSQGGEASHTLTTEEMPSHGHNPANQSGYYGFITNSSKAFEVGDMGVQSGSGRYYPYAPAAFDISRNSLTGTTGGGNSHNNMPPYLSIYIWKRTA